MENDLPLSLFFFLGAAVVRNDNYYLLADWTNPSRSPLPLHVASASDALSRPTTRIMRHGDALSLLLILIIELK